MLSRARTHTHTHTHRHTLVAYKLTRGVGVASYIGVVVITLVLYPGIPHKPYFLFHMISGLNYYHSIVARFGDVKLLGGKAKTVEDTQPKVITRVELVLCFLVEVYGSFFFFCARMCPAFSVQLP